MSLAPVPTPEERLKFAQEEVRPLTSQWLWFLVLGVALSLLGIGAISAAPFATLAFVSIFGLMLLASGVAQVITAFWSHNWRGVTLSLIIGILYVVVGLLIIERPIQAAGGFAILAAAVLISGGVIRIVTAIREQFLGWGWTLVAGVISLLLGMAIVSHFPLSIVFIGIFIGVDLLFAGMAWIVFAFALRRLKSYQDAPDRGGIAA